MKMTLKEMYKAFDGDYNDVMGRLPSESLVKKFVVKFLDDKSYQLLTDSLKNGELETAFRAAHTLKGVCQNLSFTRLYESSHAITESLRPGKLQPIDTINQQLETVSKDYETTVSAIRSYIDQDN